MARAEFEEIRYVINRRPPWRSKTGGRCPQVTVAILWLNVASR